MTIYEFARLCCATVVQNDHEGDTWALSAELHARIAAGVDGPDVSILRAFLDANPRIKRVARVYGYDDIGGPGIHGMAFIQAPQRPKP